MKLTKVVHTFSIFTPAHSTQQTLQFVIQIVFIYSQTRFLPSRHVKTAPFFHVLCGDPPPPPPTQFPNYIRRAAPKCSSFNKFKFQMHAKKLLVYRCFILRLNKVEMCFNELQIWMHFGENRGYKNRLYVRLRLWVSRNSGNGLPHPCDGP
jgi:hypothetical protein